MITRGLSVDQAPPIHVPFRFFLTAPLFGMALAATLALHGDVVFATRWSLYAYGSTHLLTLGFITMVMMGALFQMFPVLAGVSIGSSRIFAPLIHSGLVISVILFVTGLYRSNPLLLGGGLVLLVPTSLLFFLIFFFALRKAGVENHTVRSMRHALISFLFTFLAGGTLLGLHAFGLSLSVHTSLTAIHLAWALLGWVGLLIMGVTFQVLPMFYVTPEYPLLVKKRLTLALFLTLFLWSLLVVAERSLPPLSYLRLLVEISFSLGVLYYGGKTLQLLQLRLRKIFDVNVWYFRISMISLIASVILYWSGRTLLKESEWVSLVIGILFLYGFAASAIQGMLYRIVPFLVWFHLNGMGMVGAPSMRVILPPQYTLIQWIFHTAALLALSAAPLLPPGILSLSIAGILFISFLLLWLNLAYAVGVYFRQLRRYRREISPGNL